MVVENHVIGLLPEKTCQPLEKKLKNKYLQEMVLREQENGLVNMDLTEAVYSEFVAKGSTIASFRPSLVLSLTTNVILALQIEIAP